MNIEAKKIHIIEECLKIKSNSLLNKIEGLLTKAKKKPGKHSSIYDFVGIWSKKESYQIKQAIEDTSEQINEDDWK